MPRTFACDVAPELPATYFDACSLRLKEHRQVLKNSRGSLFCGPNRTAYRALSRFPVGPRDLFVEGTVLTQSHRIVTCEGQRGCAMELAATDADATDITNVWLEQKVSDVEVVIGTSKSRAAPRQIALLCNEAYGCRRLSESEARSRLAMGDDEDANRVLHLAFRNDELLGCCSSTLQPPWTPRGCGHWGLLSVHPDAQGTGVASALIAAAERRLFLSGCRSIQIEYEFTAGDPESERLLSWYEGRCGFSSSSPPPKRGSEFRCCKKRLTEETVYKPQSRGVLTPAVKDEKRGYPQEEMPRAKFCRLL
ncbi:unnamed protein product [Effrenium voratum]|uniref:N-acetyltransferase domain-containing protein n=1 Tax=Effrenium voratum TaxID=2562239 RepID=A0AA36HTL4_9DINO|nr:unnamed protein product [Effrenium voratum]CAJ1432761.1 unnamed protein product [Effrenium voratum]